MKFLPVLFALLLTGCAHTIFVSEVPEAVRQGFWAAHDAALAGKPELAQRYLNAAAPLVPPPKVRLHFTAEVRTPLTPSLFETPGAIADSAVPQDSEQEDKDIENYEQVTAPAQQIQDAKVSAELVKTEQADQVKLAAEAKYKSIVWLAIAIAVFVAATVIFCLLVKMGIITGGVASKIVAKLP